MTIPFPPFPQFPTAGPSGWVCPKCGAVYAPWIATCMNCKPPVKVTSTTTGAWQGNHEETR